MAIYIVLLSSSESIWGGVYMPYKMDTHGYLAIFRETNSQTVVVYPMQDSAPIYHPAGRNLTCNWQGDTIFQFD